MFRRTQFVLVPLLLLVAAGHLRGQGETTSAILGVVSDPSGAALPGASVTIVDADTGQKRTAQQDESAGAILLLCATENARNEC